MANPDTPGSRTSELANQKKTQAEIWVIFAATILGVVASALLETGQIIDNGWVMMLTLVAAAAAAITGKTSMANRYTTQRTGLKAEKVRAANPLLTSVPFPSGSTFSDTTPPPVQSGRGKST